jgi:hypothetical protein
MQDAQPPSPGFPSQSPLSLKQSKRGCNCKNSRCLKLYCECFSLGEYCNNCNCVNCHNNSSCEVKLSRILEKKLFREYWNATLRLSGRRFHLTRRWRFQKIWLGILKDVRVKGQVVSKNTVSVTKQEFPVQTIANVSNGNIHSAKTISNVKIGIQSFQ